jgi:hypothetical protein
MTLILLTKYIVSFKFNIPSPDDINDPNFTYYEKLATTTYSIPSQNYGGTVYLVKSSNEDLWLVGRYETVLHKFSYKFDVYKLELQVKSGQLVQINKLESLEDNILFIGFYTVIHFLCLALVSPISERIQFFFLCGDFLEDFWMGIYNMEDGSCQRLSLPLSSDLMQYCWILPQFQWD